MPEPGGNKVQDMTGNSDCQNLETGILYKAAFCRVQCHFSLSKGLKTDLLTTDALLWRAPCKGDVFHVGVLCWSSV